jgi:hypothetical protein
MSTDAGRGPEFEFQHTPENQILPNLSSQSSADLVPLIPLLLSWLVYPSTSAERDNLKHLSRETWDDISDLLICALQLSLPPPAIFLLPKFMVPQERGTAAGAATGVVEEE